MKILVCGGRNFDDRDAVKMVISNCCPFHFILIAGGAKGADQYAEEYADNRGMDKIIIKPDWDKYGKSAGYRRNEEMIALEPELVIAFWDGVSKGTAHTIKLAKKNKIDTYIYYY